MLPRAANDQPVLHTRKIAEPTLSWATAQNPAKDQHEHGAKGGQRERSRIEMVRRDRAPAESRPDVPAKKSPDDPEARGDEAPGGVAAGQKKLGQCTGHKSEDDPMKPERHVGQNTTFWRWQGRLPDRAFMKRRP